MIRRATTPVAAVLALLLSGCSGCSENGGASPDGGLDSGTDTDADTDSETDTSTWVSDAGDWEWEDNPPGEDCGPSCTQLTFTKEVKPIYWDVWGEHLAYRPDGPDERDYLYLVDIANKKRMKIPSAFESSGAEYSTVYYSALDEDYLYYSLNIYPSPSVRQLVRVDWESKTQTILLSESSGGENLAYLDVYADRLVSQAGCGSDPAENTLCLFDVSTVPAGVQTLIDEGYGNYNSIWDNVLVFTDSRPGLTFDITGYDIGTEEFIAITSDEEYTQLSPRIQGRKVVYGDLRFGTNQDGVMGDHNHQALFVYDLDTQAHIQITSGDWIAAYPDIWHEIVVWMDYRDCSQPNNINNFSNVQIWGYNLNTEQEFKITNLPDEAWPERPKEHPRIWGYKIFVDMAHSSPDIENAIYMFDLPEGAR